MDKDKFQMIKIPFIFDSSIFPQIHELVPISVEEVEELRAKIQKHELENSDLQLKLDQTIQENKYLKW